jgi:antirestriction protein ArdC
MPPFVVSTHLVSTTQRKEIPMANVYEIITDRIVKQLEAGTAPWHKPWSVPGQDGLPRNLLSGHPYRGINVWILASSGYASPYWLTLRQANELGGHVRRGEKGMPVVFLEVR